MKNGAYFKALAVVFLLGALSSCATGMAYTEMQPTIKPHDPESARIYFYRPSVFGAALQPDVLLNGEPVGKAISQGFFFVDRPPGKYEVVTSTEVKRKVSFVLEKGEIQYIRFSTSVGFFVGHVYGELVDEETALVEIKKCKYCGEEPAKL